MKKVFTDSPSYHNTEENKVCDNDTEGSHSSQNYGEINKNEQSAISVVFGLGNVFSVSHVRMDIRRM
jgi:hypothetical protein